MMTWRVRIVVVLILICGLFAIVNLIRKRSLELKYALTWLLLGVGLLCAVMIPGFLDTISSMLGIYNPMNMVFFLGFLFSVIVIFALTMSLSNNSNRVRKMAQRIALNEYKANKKQKNLKTIQVDKFIQKTVTKQKVVTVFYFTNSYKNILKTHIHKNVFLNSKNFLLWIILSHFYNRLYKKTILQSCKAKSETKEGCYDRAGNTKQEQKFNQ